MIRLEKLSLGQGDVDILKKNAPTLIKQDRVACALGREGSFFFFCSCLILLNVVRIQAICSRITFNYQSYVSRILSLFLVMIFLFFGGGGGRVSIY